MFNLLLRVGYKLIEGEFKAGNPVDVRFPLSSLVGSVNSDDEFICLNQVAGIRYQGGRSVF